MVYYINVYKYSLPLQHFLLKDFKIIIKKFTLTSRKFDVRDHFFSVMERKHIFQSISIHNQKASIIQSNCQGFPIRGEDTASST